MDAPVVYFVRFWIKPGGERKVLDWLDGGHMQNVVQQPGFLWARRYELSEADEEGWTAHAMVYGLQSQDDLDRFFTSDEVKAYAREREALGIQELLKMDRNWGPMRNALDA